jgi:hypothetical protein
MMTTANAFRSAENGQVEPMEPKPKNPVVLKLEDIQKMFVPGSNGYNQVQDIINQLQ